MDEFSVCVNFFASVMRHRMKSSAIMDFLSFVITSDGAISYSWIERGTFVTVSTNGTFRLKPAFSRTATILPNFVTTAYSSSRTV